MTEDLPASEETRASSPPVQGLFLCHFRSERVDRHFDRLVRETDGLISWHFTDEPVGRGGRAVHPPAATRMPDRHDAMVRNGGVQGGYMDMIIVPRALDLGAPFVWALEYDVDYAGDWGRFFGQFEGNGADLLTSSILSIADNPRWWYWQTARSPLPRGGHLRAFHPVMRLSRRLLEAYAAAMAVPGWTGHYEFTLPTLAAGGGFSLEDIGGSSRFSPPERRGRNYRNTPAGTRLSPGTFVWRPSLPSYYEERPELFPEPDMLYHPVKPDVPQWNDAGAPKGPLGALGALARYVLWRLRMR